MKARLLATAIVSGLLFAGVVVAADKGEVSLEGIKCFLSGKPVVAESATAYKEGKVYFCCTNCPKAFEKSTAKFAPKANAQLVATDQYVEVKCPITGRPLNPATKIEVAGVDVAFCCNGCKGKASKAEGDAQIALIFSEKPFEKGFAPKKEKKDE